MGKFPRSVNTSRILLWAVLALFGTGALAGVTESRKPRFQDLVSTKVRGAAFELLMKLLPHGMINPAIDRDEPFSYFARPSYQLGIRGEPYATQVIDGQLWTGSAEWMVLFGDPPAPHRQRIYTLYKGYLPCITYTVEKKGVHYTVRAFQFWLDETDQSLPVNFVQVKAANQGADSARARFAGGFRYGLKDHRCKQMKQVYFNPLWRYRMTEHAAVRDNKIIYTMGESPDRMQSRPGHTYEKEFPVLSRKSPCCLALYQRELGPGESFTAEFAVPQYPASLSDKDRLLEASFSERLEAMESYWEGWLSKGASFSVPENKVVDASRSYIIHALMSQDVVSDREVEQHVNRLQYNRFWLRDSAFFVSMYEKYGYQDVARRLLRHFFDFQNDEGNFLSQPGQLDGWGQSMWALGEHARFTREREFARESLPYVRRAVDWLEREVSNDSWGVMPPTDAFDNEMIRGRYTGHNFWALNGLSGAISICELLGEHELAAEYSSFREDYRGHFLSVLREVARKRNGVIPPGLDVPGGTSWGNLLPVYPGRIMDPFDPLVTATFDDYRNNHMEEGIGTWHKWLHHYLTERVAQTALVRGEQEKALHEFYSMLLHTGSCHEGFEWTIFPWDNRDYCIDMGTSQFCNFPPHGWYAADLNILFRNMLVREEGETLHLASAISPEWARPGERVSVENAPTYWGKLSYVIEFRLEGAVLNFSLQETETNHAKPEKVRFHLPYFVKTHSVTMDGRALEFEKEALDLPPSCFNGEKKECTLRFEWERLPAEELSYENMVEWYKAEYRRRWKESKGKFSSM
ncbi:MAG: hypothetical protein R6V10_08465 [bacterium]